MDTPVVYDVCFYHLVTVGSHDVSQRTSQQVVTHVTQVKRLIGIRRRIFNHDKWRIVVCFLYTPLVIGVDTVVAIDGKILGKPKNEKDAFFMLKNLSGKEHSVFTGVTVIKNDKEVTFSVQTKVKFFELDDREIEDYISSGEPFDKAGAYGIQGKGSLFVEKIDGDYFNVVGLPISRLARQLKSI